MWTPMYHVIGLTQFCMIAPKRGVINYIMAKFTLQSLLEHTERFKATDMFLMPAVLIAMLNAPRVNTIDLSSVRTANVGGAPLRESTLQRLRSIMPHKSLIIREGWGMTE